MSLSRLIHIDTIYKIPEMIEYRDRLTKEWKLTMIYGINESALKKRKHSRTAMWTGSPAVAC